jgi:multiple sugar transport system permease protein
MTALALNPQQRANRQRMREFRKVLIGLAFISPWVFGFLTLTLYPMLASLYYSFTKFEILSSPQWTGIDNFRTMFFQDKLFWKAMSNTVYFAFVSVPLGTVFSIALALLLNRKVRLMSFYRTLYYVPTVVPAVATVMLWAWILNPQVGLFNYLLSLVGIKGPGWLNDPNWSKPALILLGLWGAGSATIIYLAGLQDIPTSLYEAASIDGASSLQKTFRITLPLLTPSILFNIVMGLIGTFQYFTQAYVAGSFGGPLNSLLFYNLYLYQNAFAYYKMGYASALAWVLLVLVLTVTLAIFRTTGRWVHYAR